MNDSTFEQLPSEVADALRIIDTTTQSLEQKRRDIARRVSCHLMRHRDIAGLMIGGSLARGTGDHYSDLDLIVPLSHDSREDIHMRRMLVWVKDEPTYYEHSIARGLPFFGDLLTLFFFGLSFNIDIGFFGPNRLSNTTLEHYGIIALDRSGKLRTERDSNRSSSLPRDYDEEIWINLWKVRKAVSRKNYWRANEYLSRARRAVVSLLLREQEVPIHYQGREDDHIERLIDVESFDSTWARGHRMGYEAASLALIDIAYTLKLPLRVKKLLTVLRSDFSNMKTEPLS